MLHCEAHHASPSPVAPSKTMTEMEKITPDSLLAEVEGELAREGHARLAATLGRNAAIYRKFTIDTAEREARVRIMQLGEEARKKRLWWKVFGGFNPEAVSLLYKWFFFFWKARPTRSVDPVQSWYLEGWKQADSGPRPKVIVITRDHSVFTPDKVSFMGTVQKVGDRAINSSGETGFPVFVDNDEKSKRYTQMFTWSSKIDNIVPPNARFIGFDQGLLRGAEAYAEGHQAPYNDPALHGAFSGEEPIPTGQYLNGWNRGWSEAHNKATPFDFSKNGKAVGKKRHSPLSKKIILDTGLEMDRPQSKVEPWPGATHFEARLAERTGIGAGDPPSVKSHRFHQIAQQIVDILNETMPDQIPLTKHGGTMRALVPVPGWGCAFLWAYKHRLILRSWWPIGSEVGVQSAWPEETSRRIAVLLEQQSIKANTTETTPGPPGIGGLTLETKSNAGFARTLVGTGKEVTALLKHMLPKYIESARTTQKKKTEKIAYLDWIKAEGEGQGQGTAVMQETIQAIDAMGVRATYLHASDAGGEEEQSKRIRFFQKLGFVLLPDDATRPRRFMVRTNA